MKPAATAAVLAVSLAATTAHAFERTRVDTNPDLALFWQFRTVRVYPAYDTSEDVGPGAVEAAIGRSIATWNAAAVGCSDLVLEDGGYPPATGTNLFGGVTDMENRIVWREDSWPEDMSPDTLALTTLVYRRSTGEIVDADIDLNGFHHTFTDVDDPVLVQTDIENTLTHELGHLIGLAHVADPEATMYERAPPGDLDKRTLSPDDRDGLCWIYPEGRISPSAPRRMGGELMSGCAVRPGTVGGPAAGLALILLVGLRRRRAGRR